MTNSKPEGEAPQAERHATLQEAIEACRSEKTVEDCILHLMLLQNTAPAAQHAESGAQALDGIEKAYRACQSVSSGFDHDSGERLGARACIAAVKELYLAAQSQGAQAAKAYMVEIEGEAGYQVTWTAAGIENARRTGFKLTPLVVAAQSQGAQAAWECRRYCKGDGEWTEWRAIGAEEYERRKDDSAFEFRALSAQSQGAQASLDDILSCYSPDDTVGDYQDKIRALFGVKP